MKKLISIVLSVLMLASVISVSVVPAMAKTYSSQQTTTAAREINTEVNGKGTNDITYKVDPTNKDKITFTYTGKGDVDAWEFDGLVEGEDYEIISQDGNSITILFDSAVGDINVNAVVEGLEDNDDDTTAKGDNGNKSPNTGASLAGVAVAGAGVAMLLGLKKKD